MGNLRASCKLSADFACSNLPDAFEQASNPFSLGFSLVHYLQIKFPISYTICKSNFLSASYQQQCGWS
jgi:hypothetical protein